MSSVVDQLVTWAEVDLDAIDHNLRAFREYVGEQVGIIAVVKANAYGHGAVPVSRAVLEAGATHLAVHRLTEGVELRRAGIQAPVLIMGYTPAASSESVVRWGLTPTVTSAALAEALSACAEALGVTVPVHLKVDTGMNRLGLLPDEVYPFTRLVRGLPGLELQGLFTTFATAASADQTHLGQQVALFRDLVDGLESMGVRVPLIHAANSAAALQLREARFDAVRPGIAIYGMDPSDEWSPPIDLRPVLTLKSRVGRVRELPAGAAVSYGRTYVAAHPMQAALVCLGYGDGFHRILSGRGNVLIHGQRAPIVGRVCMDQFVVDVSHIGGVHEDDEVVLIGRQEQGEIKAEEVGRLAGTISYEMTTSLLPRVTRVYVRDGAVVSTLGID